MKRTSHIRRIRSFRRKSGRIAPRPVTLIVCEGETEQEYFEAARVQCKLTNAQVIIAENSVGSAPISVVQCAEQKSKEAGGYDQIYCVFDRDGHESFDRAREKIRILATRSNKPLPISEAISIPCFEIWILLHFERTDAPFNQCQHVVQRIRDSHLSGYQKANTEIAQQLVARSSDAISNAVWLEARSQNNDFNPYTSVYKVIQHFKAVADQQML